MTSRPCWRRRPGVGGAGDDKPTVADVATHVPQVAHGNQTKQQVARCGPAEPMETKQNVDSKQRAAAKASPGRAHLSYECSGVAAAERPGTPPRLDFGPRQQNSNRTACHWLLFQPKPCASFYGRGRGLGSAPPSAARIFLRYTHGRQNTLPFNQTKRIFS